MSTENIGINAGSVWNVLNEKEKWMLKHSKAPTSLKDLNMALGWL